MALLVDASTPALAAASNDPWTTASFTPPVNSLLVLVAMGDWFGGGTATLTPSSTGLTFTSRLKVGSNNNGVVQIWTAELGANGGSARTVSCTTSMASDVGGIKAYVFTGYDTTTIVDITGNGSSVTNNITPTVLTTGVAGCWVLAGSVEWQSNGVPTSTDVSEGFDDVDLSLMCVRKSAATASASAVTLNFDAFGGSAAQWLWGAISIRPAAGGVTAVGKDLALQWDTRAALGDTVQAVWDVRAAVSDTVQAVWDVRQAVGDPVALQWDTRALAAKSVQALWDVRQAIGDPVALQWDTRALTARDVQALWDIRAAIGDPIQLIWDVQSALIVVGKDLGLLWDTRAVAGDPLQIIWDTRALASKSAQLSWDVRAALADELALFWGVRTVAGRAVEAQWIVRALAGKNLNLLWDTEAPPFTPAGKPTASARQTVSEGSGRPIASTGTARSVDSTATPGGSP